MMMGAHALLGMAYTLRESGHIRIDAFSQIFSEGAKAVIDLVGYVVFLLPCLLWMTWSLWDYWMTSLQHAANCPGQSAWNPDIWPFKLSSSSLSSCSSCRSWPKSSKPSSTCAESARATR